MEHGKLRRAAKILRLRIPQVLFLNTDVIVRSDFMLNGHDTRMRVYRWTAHFLTLSVSESPRRSRLLLKIIIV